jgi:hypothetical protein
MTEEDISNALGQRLVAVLPATTVVFENRDGLPANPYVAAEVVRVSTTDDTLTGGFKISRGFLQATVVTEAGIFANPALQIADEIAAGFAYGDRISITDGVILITKPPAIGQGFRDGPDWRVPVRIDYEAEEQ